MKRIFIWLRCILNKHEPEAIGLEFGSMQNGLQLVRIIEICKHCGNLYVFKE